MNIGSRVRVTWNKKSKTGEIIYENDSFITVQFKNYKECFLKVDIANAEVEVVALD
ncbi:MAG: hypothetical protein KAZ81_00325 [Candidatus Syntrophosphaera sp.]|nr:hypothetical protein [Candidatus Syntrophosphaera sp.]